MKGVSSSTAQRAENDAERGLEGGGGGVPPPQFEKKIEIWKQLDDIWCHLKLTIVIIYC